MIMFCVFCVFFFFFKQKTAYEMRISDWSSDVCSSDLFRYGTRFDTYTVDDWRVGIGICYDMGFPETARCLAVNGAELLIAPYATPRKHMFQEEIGRASCRERVCQYV